MIGPNALCTPLNEYSEGEFYARYYSCILFASQHPAGALPAKLRNILVLSPLWRHTVLYSNAHYVVILPAEYLGLRNFMPV
jgi:hypothetical protein